MVQKNAVYVHYKNPTHNYRVIEIAKNCETLEDLVIYKALYEGNFPRGQVWVRKLSDFEAFVGDTPRFKKRGTNNHAD